MILGGTWQITWKQNFFRGGQEKFLQKRPFFRGGQGKFLRKSSYFRGGQTVLILEIQDICRVRGGQDGSRIFQGGYIDLAGKLGGGQYFAAEGREIEGSPPWICLWQLPLEEKIGESSLFLQHPLYVQYCTSFFHHVGIIPFS